ncbi:unnamed protein product [Calypogeia fissa]
MSTMYTVVLQAASAHGSEQMVQLRRAASESATVTADMKVSNGTTNAINGTVDYQLMQSKSMSTVPSEKATAPSLRGIVMEYYGPGQRLREIYLASREGERFAVPITLAVQLSPLLREFVESVISESARGRFNARDKAKLTIDVPCSTDALRTMVDFVTAKLELDLKLSEEGVKMSEEQKKEHWRDYIYSRVSWRMDLDDFADDIVQVADYLSMKSLYDLMKCCFRLRL